MRNSLIFDGINTSEYGVYITGAGIYDTPTKRYTTVSIEGRNGDLILEDNPNFATFDNINVRYPAVIMNDFTKNYKAFKSKLSANRGYAMLTDTIEPERFRYGTFKEVTSLRMTDHFDAGTFEIIFECKPQWFLSDGMNPIVMTASGAIFNPTSHASKPIIKATGNGSITLNSNTIVITNNASKTIWIDSEIEDAYTGSTNRNSDVTFSNNEFPLIVPEYNNIVLGGVTIEIVPRWYEI